ncbi:hypothetical protein PM082_020391 [Marasmius tenuissimus]|nr:hypothetical protein PM082_020391 [Marasmius tenuissimus]
MGSKENDLAQTHGDDVLENLYRQVAEDSDLASTASWVPIFGRDLSTLAALFNALEDVSNSTPTTDDVPATPSQTFLFSQGYTLSVDDPTPLPLDQTRDVNIPQVNFDHTLDKYKSVIFIFEADIKVFDAHISISHVVPIQLQV